MHPYPLPLIIDIVNTILGFQRLPFFDTFLGYNKIPLYEPDQIHTLFIIEKGYIAAG